MALQLSKRPQNPYLAAENHAVNQVGPGYTWHIDKNVVEPVALAMLPALTGPIAQRGMLLVVCNASSVAPHLRSFAAAAAAQAILRNYYYKVEQSSHSKMLFHAIVEGIREANDAVAQQFWPDDEQRNSLTLIENFAGLSATAVVAQSNRIVIGSVGDTQAYRLRNGKLAPYEQSQSERLIILEDAFRKGDRLLVCTHALAATNGVGRIRAAANTSTAASPAALHALVDVESHPDLEDILAVAMLYRNATQPATTGALMIRRPAELAAPVSAPRITRWVTLASLLFVFLATGWLLFEGQRSRFAVKLSATPPALATPLPLATRLVSVPVLIGADNAALSQDISPAISDSKTLSVVITTSEPGKVVFQLAATETPGVNPTPTTQAPVATQTRVIVRVIPITPIVKPSATVVQPQPTSPPAPQPTSPPAPQPPADSPPAPPAPTSAPKPTAVPPQPTSPPPQPTAVPPQPTSPPPQPTEVPPQPTSAPPPDLSVPCLPGDAQCKP